MAYPIDKLVKKKFMDKKIMGLNKATKSITIIAETGEGKIYIKLLFYFVVRQLYLDNSS